jgi:hypothetical protein
MMKAKVRQKMDKPLAEKPCLTLEREHGGSLGLARRPDRVLVAPFEYGGEIEPDLFGALCKVGPRRVVSKRFSRRTVKRLIKVNLRTLAVDREIDLFCALPTRG